MPNQPQTTGQIISTAERRAYVLKMRKAGATYAEIARAAINHFGKLAIRELEDGGGSWVERYGTTDIKRAIDLAGREVLPQHWDERYAWKDVKRELDKLRDEVEDSAEAVRTLELQRLDDMLKSLWPLVARSNPDLKAMDRVLKLMERRARLTGLDSPQKIAPTTPDGEEPYSPDKISVYVHK